MSHKITRVKSILRQYQTEIEGKLEKMLDAEVTIDLIAIIDKAIKVETEQHDN